MLPIAPPWPRSPLAGFALLALAACGGSPNAPAASAAAESATPAPVTRIMPLGDSITQGNDETNSYRRALWKRLQAGGRVDFVGSQRDNHLGPPPNPDFDLDHEGHWGWRADEVLGQVEGWARAHAPDVVLVHLGSNDLFQGQDVGSTLAELGGIVERLRAANPRVSVLLARIIPAARGVRPAQIDDLNAGVSALAARLDSAASRVALADQHTGFDADADTHDGIHPNAVGEEKMAAVWQAALQGVLGRARP